MDLDFLVLLWGYGTAICGVLFFFDDLFVDLVSVCFGLKPQQISTKAMGELKKQTARKIAIVIANWHEEAVLERMVQGNLGQLDYPNFTIFLGVYPNDTATRAIAETLAQKYSQVEVVVNSQEGPTSKGQMLNEVLARAFQIEQKRNYQIESFLIHDSEDIIHPLSLWLINANLSSADFLQVPVFSLPVGAHELVAGTYVDEFSEVHTKDMLVRQFLGAALPSAGVGTALSRRLIQRYQQEFAGEVFRKDALTEDYILGLQTKQFNFRSKFLCYYLQQDGKRNFIATREFFPKRIWNSIRQKTRWTQGIAWQGLVVLGWSKYLAQNYFYYRDRRITINSLVVISGALLFFYSLALFLIKGHGPSFMQDKVFIVLLVLNTASMVQRFLWRTLCVCRTTGWRAALPIILRWPVGITINGVASVRAALEFIKANLTGKKTRWSKTIHELPDSFGLEAIAKAKVAKERASG